MTERFELISALRGVDTSSGGEASTRRNEQVAWVRAGIAALEARLEAFGGTAAAADRAMLVTLLISLEDALRNLSVESEAQGPNAGSTLGQQLPPLEAHLADVGARIRTRVVYSGDPPHASNPLLRVVPATGSIPVRPGSWWMVVGRALTGLGIAISAFLVFEFLLTGLFHDRAQQDLLARFKQGIHSTTLDAPTTTPAVGSPVALLEIPRIGLSQIVAEGTNPEDLKAGPGHLRTAPLPGEFGNAVVAGRRETYGAPFKALNLLKVGDTIRATTGQGVFIYRVDSVRTVPAGQAAPLAATLDTRLTLVTSDPPFAPTRRLVIVAKLGPQDATGDPTGTPVAVASRPPVSAGITELGLTGDAAGLVGALVFGQLLVFAIWLTIRLRRRWPLSLVLLFAVPTLLTLSVLTFSSVDRLLPGTL